MTKYEFTKLEIERIAHKDSFSVFITKKDDLENCINEFYDRFRGDIVGDLALEDKEFDSYEEALSNVEECKFYVDSEGYVTITYCEICSIEYDEDNEPESFGKRIMFLPETIEI